MFNIVTYDTFRMYSSNLFSTILAWTFLLDSRKKKEVCSFTRSISGVKCDQISSLLPCDFDDIVI